MNFSLFDKLRRETSPVELELVEAYASGSISRRAFVQRGSVIGLSMAFMGSVIAACGSDKGSTTATSTTVATSTGGGGTTATSGSTEFMSMNISDDLPVPVAPSAQKWYGARSGGTFEVPQTISPRCFLKAGNFTAWTPSSGWAVRC